MDDLVLFRGVLESLLQILCIKYIGNIFFANVLKCSSCPFLTKVCYIVSLVPEGVLAVGTVVWAHTSKIRYYKGFVSYKGTKLHVDLYDGDKFLYELKDASRKVIPDVPPKAADIKRGTRVIAKFKNMQRYYSSTVMEVDASDASEPRYHVKLDDGDETWDSLYHLRLLPKEVQIEGNLAVCFQSLTHFLVFLFCCTLFSRDFSSTVSGLRQDSIVPLVASAFIPKHLAARQEKPLVPRFCCGVIFMNVL